MSEVESSGHRPPSSAPTARSRVLRWAALAVAMAILVAVVVVWWRPWGTADLDEGRVDGGAGVDDGEAANATCAGDGSQVIDDQVGLCYTIPQD